MNWQELLNIDIQKFIHDHKNGDVKALALQKPPNQDWPYTLILDQIKAYQKLKKIPVFDKKGMIYPPADLIEQASSWACAQLKASLFTGKSFVDLTAGSGSDIIAFSKNFTSNIAVEQDAYKAEILKHNLKTLKIENIDVKNTAAEEFIKSMTHSDLVYIDPQRRDGKRRGIYDLSECSPNITKLLKCIKAQNILIKTSPVLDIKKTLRELNTVNHVYVIEYEGECKELLFHLIPKKEINADDVPITTLRINERAAVTHQFIFTHHEETNAQIECAQISDYLYEPSAAFQKAGAFKLMAKRYGLKKIHPNTHLYTSSRPVTGFPGRSFKVCATTTANYKALKAILPGMKANLTIRNFPMRVEDLRKKLKIKDGGNITLFACTDHTEGKIIIKCEKH